MVCVLWLPASIDPVPLKGVSSGTGPTNFHFHSAHSFHSSWGKASGLCFVSALTMRTQQLARIYHNIKSGKQKSEGELWGAQKPAIPLENNLLSMKTGHDRDEIHYWSTLINTIYLTVHTPRLFHLPLVPSVVTTNYCRVRSSDMYSRRSV